MKLKEENEIEIFIEEERLRMLRLKQPQESSGCYYSYSEDNTEDYDNSYNEKIKIGEGKLIQSLHDIDEN